MVGIHPCYTLDGGYTPLLYPGLGEYTPVIPGFGRIYPGLYPGWEVIPGLYP